MRNHIRALFLPDVDRRNCELLGPTALIVQALLGLLILLSLVFKRYTEKPHRPWRIWLFDVSKQVFGQMFVHGLNVFVSAGSSFNGCVFYFLNILVDTTLGVLVLYAFLHISTYMMSDIMGYRGYESGKYGNPPSLAFWARQTAIYVVSLTVMKFLVLATIMYTPGAIAIGEWLLSWTYTESGDDLQVIFVMGIFPIVMNIIQFWIIDSIVKAKAAVSLDSTDDLVHSSQDREPLFSAHSDDEDDCNARVLRRRSGEDAEAGRFRPSSIGQMSEESRTIYVPSRNSKYNNSDTDAHEYPPTLSSSLPSSSSSSNLPSSFTGTTQSTSPSSVSSHPHHIKLSRSPPPHTGSLPVMNSPSAPPFSVPRKLQMPQPQSNATWDNSWDDGDWAEHHNDV